MIITACFFEDYLNCHTKCWLRSRGESGTGNTYADWVRTQSEAYREGGINRLLEGMLSDEYIVAPTEPTNLDIKKYQLVVDFKLRAEGAALLSSASPPDLILNQHCVECEFRTQCGQKAIEKDDLSLVSSLSKKERSDFNNKGIFTVNQLSYTFRPRRRPKKLRDKREKYHYPLKALAIREKKIHVIGNPEFKIEGTAVYLDIEGLPDRDFYYLIGVRIKTTEGVIQHSLWAENPDEEKRIWTDFLDVLTGVGDPVLVHYGSYETMFVKRMCERYGKPAEDSAAAKAFKSAVNLLSIVFAQIYFPTYSNGLKDIARWLGFKWSAQDASGVQSIIWRGEWEQTKDALPRGKLIGYNSEDCAALELIARTVSQVCQQSSTTNSPVEDCPEVVFADDTDSKTTMWPRFTSSIEGFEAINKAARWDYQRDRIYIRTDGNLRRAKQKRTSSARSSLPISKVVVCEPPRICPRCLRKGTQDFRRITKRLHDLRFSKTGVRGWVVAYEFQVFRCPACRAFTPWPKEFWDRTQYGRNLAAFTIFEIIALCVSQRSVTQTLNRLFGFQMHENAVRRFKVKGAAYYEETRKKILAEMLKGNLIHADETRIKLHDKTAYVWVFATFHEVVYLYSETREGNLVQGALDGFKGVLVSDFYAAYDSMPCHQQKCLLHLMRDLNDFVLDNPYDESVKEIVTAFAELLRGIVKTVDQWGLKSRFLRKHLVDVARFYKRISRMEHLSTVALKLKTRLDKDRDKLFTFLNHDGVPWNNNNVEHAIKAFARLRRCIEGLSTPKGIEEYLILLSVCQTCKYSGVDFLNFLRSGEIDVNTFAASQSKRRACVADQ